MVQLGDEARYAYLRVPCLYPGERGYVATALQNAGQVFIEMSQKPDIDQAISDSLFMDGMRLLGECGGRYRGTVASSRAGKLYRQHKARYEELKAQASSAAAAKKDDDAAAGK